MNNNSEMNWRENIAALPKIFSAYIISLILQWFNFDMTRCRPELIADALQGAQEWAS